MFTKQRGSALAISLSLLLIITIVGVAGATNSFLGERQAANQKQIFDALMAAERGLVNAKHWFDDPVNFTSWGDEQAARDGINAILGAIPAHEVSWSIQNVTFTGNNATIISCGTIVTTGVNRCLTSIYQQGSGGGNLAALNIVGVIDEINAANSDSFQIRGEYLRDADGNAVLDADGNYIYIGPAVATDTAENYQKIVDAIADVGREHNYKGGVKQVNFGGPFGDPNEMNAFIEAIKAECMGGTAAATCKSNNAVAPIQQVNSTGGGYRFDNDVERIYLMQCDSGCTFSGNTSGKGILIVEGNLVFSGTPSFEGLMIVTGNAVQINGLGQGGITGSAVITNLAQDAEGEWSFGTATATIDLTIQGGGSGDIVYDRQALIDARNLLAAGGAAQNIWEFGENDDETNGAGSGSRMFAWGEYNP